jgi:hypothetical protein
MMNCQQRLTGPYFGTPVGNTNRGHELLAFNYTAAPQNITIALRFFEGGTVRGDNYGVVIQVGSNGTISDAPGVLVYRNIDAGGGYRPSFRLTDGSFTIDNSAFPIPSQGDLVEIVENAYWEGGLAKHTFSQRLTTASGVGSVVTATADSTTPRAIPANYHATNITLGRAYINAHGFAAINRAAVFAGNLSFQEALTALLAL